MVVTTSHFPLTNSLVLPNAPLSASSFFQLSGMFGRFSSSRVDFGIQYSCRRVPNEWLGRSSRSCFWSQQQMSLDIYDYDIHNYPPEDHNNNCSVRILRHMCSHGLTKSTRVCNLSDTINELILLCFTHKSVLNQSDFTSLVRDSQDFDYLPVLFILQLTLTVASSGQLKIK